MAPKSHTLFHFTKNRDTLKLIFKNGFWPRYCLEDISWINETDGNHMAFPMVCFCDIPLSRISEHVAFYGNYGLGLTKEWANKNGLNPVLYLASENNLTKEIRALNDHANDHESEEKIEESKHSSRYLYMHIKPSDGTMIIDRKQIKKEFYQESEWRYVPKHEEIKAYLTPDEFNIEKELEERNKETKKYGTLKITPEDVKYIFVKDDSDIPEMINFIQNELDHFPALKLKVLMSRVISLDSIQTDF